MTSNEDFMRYVQQGRAEYEMILRKEKATRLGCQELRMIVDCVHGVNYYRLLGMRILFMKAM